jgi:hypothetical protein
MCDVRVVCLARTVSPFGVDTGEAQPPASALTWTRKNCSMAPDHYSVLGVSRDSSDADIKKAYRKEALKWRTRPRPLSCAAHRCTQESVCRLA